MLKLKEALALGPGANFECKTELKTKVNLVQIILSSTLKEKLAENQKQI